MDNLLHIGEASAGTDLLEGIFYLVGALHLTLHFTLQELRPKLLGKVVFLHFELIGIFVLISSGFSDLLLSGNAVHASLKGFFLVLN